MPSRWLCLTIVAFWLGMMGWLAGREWWQRYGLPPTMLSALDAVTAEGIVKVKWRLLGNGQIVGNATTDVKYDGRNYVLEQKADLDMDMIGNLPLFQFLGPLLANMDFKQLKIDTTTELNPFGDLSRFKLDVTIPNPTRQAALIREPNRPPQPIAKFTLESRPKPDGLLWAKLSLALSGENVPLPAPYNKDYPLPYRGRDLALGSLCPMDRMPGLRPGQTWQTPVSDPSSLIMFGMPGANNGVFTTLMDRQPAQVRVLREPEVLQWQGHDIACWIVVTDQDNLHLRIWAQQSDGLILKQSAEWGKTRIDIIRESTETSNERESPRRAASG
jgi:hypothetical protein